MNTTNIEKKTNPIWAMFSYISKIFFKSISTYVLFGVFTFIFILILTIPAIVDAISNEINGADKNMVYIAFSVAQSFSMVSIAVYSLIKTCSIFLDTQNEGTEILIVSKPITRWQIFLARFSFLLLYGLAISLINSLLILIWSAIYNCFSSNERGILFIGTFGSEIILFLLIFSITLLIGLSGGIKMARTFPILIYIGSNIINFIVPTIVNITSENPISKINNNFINYVNKELENGSVSLETNFGSNDNNKITSVKYIKLNEWGWEQDLLFNADPSKNAIFINKNANPSLIAYDGIPDFSQKDPYSGINKKYLEGQEAIMNLFSKYDIFKLLNKSCSRVNANAAIVTMNYLNPLSAINKITGFSSKAQDAMFYDSLSLDLGYNYYNIAPELLDGKHYLEKDKTYYSYYSKDESDPIWALSLLWVAIFSSLIGASFFKYVRKDLK